MVSGRFLPEVPGRAIEAIFNAARGNEIASGKFDSPESSAALAANAFGLFLHEAAVELPPLPGCAREAWPARSLNLEFEIRFAWRGGRHPVLDCVVQTPTALIGIESKRFEPFRSKGRPSLSEAYWRPVWGDRMRGYENVRDNLRDEPGLYAHLDGAQLFKHALALRTEVHRASRHRGLRPILFYLHAEPEIWPATGRPVDERAKVRHRDEIEAFRTSVANDEVVFVPCAWRRLLDAWMDHGDARIRGHAARVIDRFSP